MKEIYIIIRPNMYFKTKEELAKNNFNSISVKDVTSRLADNLVYEVADGSGVTATEETPFIAKKMIEIFCRDEDEQKITDIVLKINQTNHPGDGMIYVVDLEDCTRIRTGENGINAIM